MSMDKLEKKLDKLGDALKNVKASIKMPKMSMPKPPSSPKMPGVAPKTQKDPEKVAQQIKDPDIKDQVMDSADKIKESMSTSKFGQWSIKSK